MEKWVFPLPIFFIFTVIIFLLIPPLILLLPILSMISNSQCSGYSCHIFWLYFAFDTRIHSILKCYWTWLFVVPFHSSSFPAPLITVDFSLFITDELIYSEFMGQPSAYSYSITSHSVTWSAMMLLIASYNLMTLRSQSLPQVN